MKLHSNNIIHCRSNAGRVWAMQAVTFLLALTCAFNTHAQDKFSILNGNEQYNKGNYKKAADYYTKALSKKPDYTPGLFNLGNSLYNLKKYDSSRKVMAMTEKIAKEKEGKAAANYNIGNTWMAEKKWDEAIEAYKKTLRNNPQDMDAKYNLSYAEKMKAKQDQQKKDDKNKDKNKDQQDKNKDNQNKDKDKDKDKNKDKDQKDQQNDNKDDKNKDQEQPQAQPKANIDKKTAEQVLNALQNEEKKLQDKMRKEKGAPVRPDKDW